MGSLIVYMLNALGGGPSGTTSALTQSMAQYNPALYHAALTIHSTAVKPVTSIVLAIIATMMLATNSAKIEADRELGIKIVASSMLKVALVLTACQYAPTILDGLAQIGTSIAHAAQGVDAGAGSGNPNIGDKLRKRIDDAGTMKQLGMLVILVIPFIVAKVGTVVAIVLVFIRFLQMYMLSAFSSLPIAFLSHEDTKGIGIGYLKKFGVASLTGAVLVIATKFYEVLMGSWLGDHLGQSDDILKYITQNFGNFLVAPVVLVFLLVSANGLAKAIVGEG